MIPILIIVSLGVGMIVFIEMGDMHGDTENIYKNRMERCLMIYSAIPNNNGPQFLDTKYAPKGSKKATLVKGFIPRENSEAIYAWVMQDISATLSKPDSKKMELDRGIHVKDNHWFSGNDKDTGWGIYVALNRGDSYDMIEGSFRDLDEAFEYISGAETIELYEKEVLAFDNQYYKYLVNVNKDIIFNNIKGFDMLFRGSMNVKITNRNGKPYTNNGKVDRPSWDEYFMNIAKAISARSTCLRRRYGALIVDENRAIISTGYNGSACGEVNCYDVGKCKRESLNVPKGERYELCEAVHAEANAIINGSKIRMKNSTIYIYGENVKDNSIASGEPCLMCRRMIINAGIKKVIGSCNGKLKFRQYDMSKPPKETCEKTVETKKEDKKVTPLTKEHIDETLKKANESIRERKAKEIQAESNIRGDVNPKKPTLTKEHIDESLRKANESIKERKAEKKQSTLFDLMKSWEKDLDDYCSDNTDSKKSAQDIKTDIKKKIYNLLDLNRLDKKDTKTEAEAKPKTVPGKVLMVELTVKDKVSTDGFEHHNEENSYKFYVIRTSIQDICDEIYSWMACENDLISAREVETGKMVVEIKRPNGYKMTFVIKEVDKSAYSNVLDKLIESDDWDNLIGFGKVWHKG